MITLFIIFIIAAMLLYKNINKYGSNFVDALEEAPTIQSACFMFCCFAIILGTIIIIATYFP